MSPDDRRTRQSGFTLLELLITVVIIGILASIAYPSYQTYVQRTRQAEVKTQLLGLQTAMERYRAQKLTYKDAKVADLAGELAGNRFYDVGELSIGANGQSYTLLVRPKGIMKGTGAYAVNNLGQRCFNKSSDSSCSSFKTGWD